MVHPAGSGSGRSRTAIFRAIGIQYEGHSETAQRPLQLWNREVFSVLSPGFGGGFQNLTWLSANPSMTSSFPISMIEYINS